jgi:hypothetical protein
MGRYLDLAMQVQPTPVTDLVGRWLQKFCVPSTACRVNPAFLYSEFSVWSGRRSGERAFLEELRRLGYPTDTSGMIVGLALADDFLEALKREPLMQN